MPDDNSYPVIHPSIQREIDREVGSARTEAKSLVRAAENQCDARHRRQNTAWHKTVDRVDDHHETLIDLVGKRGGNGKVGELRKALKDQRDDHEELEHRQRSDHELLAQIKHGQFKYAAAGAGAGGGGLLGLIEALKYLF